MVQEPSAPTSRPGYKLFSVSGDCAAAGRVRVPDGHHRGRAAARRSAAKGPRRCRWAGPRASACPPSHFDRTIAYEDIPTGGSIIVFGPQRDMLDVAENFLEFFVDESCGQCTPCREGVPKLLEGVEMLQQGKCSMDYLQRALLAGRDACNWPSKCGLGQSAPNALLSIVEHFQDEILGRDRVA